MGTATMQHSRKSEEFWSGVRQELPLIVGVAPFGLVYGVLGVARVVNNDFHKERKEFRYPKWWGSKPWHRGGKKGEMSESPNAERMKFGQRPIYDASPKTF